jgi:hypothetical protein
VRAFEARDGGWHPGFDRSTFFPTISHGYAPFAAIDDYAS